VTLPLQQRIAATALALSALALADVAPPRQGDRGLPPGLPPARDAAPPRAQGTGANAVRPEVERRERAAEAAVRRSLAYLAGIQSTTLDGSFPTTGAEHAVPVPVAALAALAYMAGGSTPDRGPYGSELAAAIDYLISRCDLSSGSGTRGYIASEGDALSRMHGHGFATLALSQAFAMSPQTSRGARTRSALEAAVQLIESSQGPEGGWYYHPVATYQHENSVTVCLVQALRGAHGAGIRVAPRTIDKAVDYIRRCQEEDGSFRYALNEKSTSAALTAAGIATLNAIGVYDGPVIARALEFLGRDLAARENEVEIGDARSPHYERLYIAQALWQASDTRLWETWRTRIVAELEAEQDADGSWHDAKYGDAYATAMYSLVLSIPQGLLPIFQR
jgi:hypothetical protein